MKTIDLFLSNVNITEDEYNYKGYLTLSTDEKSLDLDLSDMDAESKLHELKTYFDLDEDTAEIRNVIMDKIIEKENISSLIVEGENFEETSRMNSLK